MRDHRGCRRIDPFAMLTAERASASPGG